MALDRILMVDDEDLIRWSLQQKITNWGYRAFEAPNAQSALAIVERESPDLVLLDIHLPDGSGIDVLKAIKESNPRAIVVMMTAYGVLEDAVAALRLGAYDFVAKPLNFEELRATIGNALEAIKLRQEVRHFRERDRKRFSFENIVGESEPIRSAVALMKKVAASPATTILFQGESGTGKDLFAKAIHFHSSRADRPFLAVNCAALPETLVESELFGYEKGAFTDARQQKKGLMELADGGTIFLDEIGEMHIGLQAKLLRILEEQSFKRVGGVNDVRVDVRIIASSNRDLKKMVEKEKFRQDLYYRLNVVTITLPPLRDRGEDVGAPRSPVRQGLQRALRQAHRGPDAGSRAPRRAIPLARKRTRAPEPHRAGDDPRGRTSDRRRGASHRRDRNARPQPGFRPSGNLDTREGHLTREGRGGADPAGPPADAGKSDPGGAAPRHQPRRAPLQDEEIPLAGSGRVNLSGLPSPGKEPSAPFCGRSSRAT